MKSSLKIERVIIIQTAFIGDVILSTPLLEAIHRLFPDAIIDFVLRKGNEGLFEAHPYLNEVFIWDKKRKYASLFETVKKVNSGIKYDLLFNLQRFASTGLMAALISAKVKIGFKKNPLSFLMTYRVPHEIGNGRHEVERNLDLMRIINIDPSKEDRVKLYPGANATTSIAQYLDLPFVTISPASVWYTKQVPFEKWIELIQILPADLKIYLLGSKSDKNLCNLIVEKCNSHNVISLAGITSFLETAALMSYAILNYTNDSAPMHIASSQNANVCAIYCSTVPEFGFGPLSDFRRIVQVDNLSCKPCGLHGYKSCPEGHFKCGYDLEKNILLNAYHDALNFPAESK